MDKLRFAKLVKGYALEYGTFTLKSGLTSHFYLDLRRLTLSTGLFEVCGMLHEEIVRSGVTYNAIGGPESGANQIVGGYQVYRSRIDRIPSNLHGFVVRKQEKDHGASGLIVGNLRPGDPAVLVEDVTTTGGSVVRAANLVREFGAHVVLVVSLVDRQQGAAETFEKAGLAFRSILTLDDLEIEPSQP